jgi:CofD-related protein of GAK system
MTVTLKITRTATLPDPIRLARYLRAPEVGPRVLFFSGGTALNPLSRVLIKYTHNSTHLITPFDSGGSSAKLRQAFHMPAVGDLRNRLMALSDQTVMGNPAIVRLFAHRFPKDAEPADLEDRLQAMIRGRHRLVVAIPDPMRKIIRTHLSIFKQAKPQGFDLRGASVGNLVLTGGYLNNDRHLDPVTYLFAKLAEVRGVVRATVNRDLHLVSELKDGRVLVGQHLLTGREVPPIDSPVRSIYLSQRRETMTPYRQPIRRKVWDLIGSAELICFAMGSFYSSLLANLLPQGVAEAVAENDCPKVYIPSTGVDCELVDETVADTVKILLDYLYQGAAEATTEDLLNYVLIDSKKGQYPRPVDQEKIRRLGVEVIDTDLAPDPADNCLDPEKLAGALLSLI